MSARGSRGGCGCVGVGMEDGGMEDGCVEGRLFVLSSRSPDRVWDRPYRQCHGGRRRTKEPRPLSGEPSPARIARLRTNKITFRHALAPRSGAHLGAAFQIRRRSRIPRSSLGWYMFSDLPHGTQVVPAAFGTKIAGDASGPRLWVPLARDQERSAGSVATEYSWGADIPGGAVSDRCRNIDIACIPSTACAVGHGNRPLSMPCP